MRMALILPPKMIMNDLYRKFVEFMLERPNIDIVLHSATIHQKWNCFFLLLKHPEIDVNINENNRYKSESTNDEATVTYCYYVSKYSNCKTFIRKKKKQYLCK